MIFHFFQRKLENTNKNAYKYRVTAAFQFFYSLFFSFLYFFLS